MKTDEEWIKLFGDEEDGISCEGPSEEFILKFIKKVQEDTIRGCAEIVGQMPYRFRRMKPWDGPYREACQTGFVELQGMADDIKPK